MILNRQVRTIGIHVAAWSCFIAYEVAVAESVGTHAGFMQFAVFYALNISLFYFNAEVVLRFASNLRKVAVFMIPLLLLELSIYLVLGLTISYIFSQHQGGYKFSHIGDDAVIALWRAVYFIGLSFGYWFYKRSMQKTREANQLKILQLESEKTHIATQIAYLKSQINPHFLFNSLNYIYNSVNKVSLEAGAEIMLLSEIMRYSLKDGQPDGKVFLYEEIAQIKRYVQLMQLRFSNKLFLILTLPERIEDNPCRIPPLILLTFVENIFKHADLSDEAEPALIAIACDNDELKMRTQNKKRKKRVETGTKIGIHNAKTRLNLHYLSNSFDLTISDSLTHFSVNLRISL